MGAVPNIGSIPDQIARVIAAAGFGSGVHPILARTEAVPKSAFAQPGERPDVARHRATMAVESVVPPSPRITLVDDFVTKGRTLFGAASVLARAYPEADVRAFALVRTMGLVPDIGRILEPCVGRIVFDARGEDVDRLP